MILHLEQVFSAEDSVRYLDALKNAEWVSGETPAGPLLAKTNWQLPEDHPIARELGDKVLLALRRHPLFMRAALPLHVFPPLFTRYEGADAIGTCVDDAIREISETLHRVRADLSATLFLSSPDSYDGGELVVEDSFGTHAVKLPAGDMILYPSNRLHHVRPVTRGARICSFFWIQSMIRSDQQRSLLFDLDFATQRIAAEAPQHPSAIQLTGIYHNLLRMWAEL